MRMTRTIAPTREYFLLDKNKKKVKTFTKFQFTEFREYVLKHPELVPYRLTKFGRNEEMHFNKPGKRGYSVRKSVQKAQAYREGEACNRCGAMFGEPCRTPSGKIPNLPHLERRLSDE